jgi:hypothetical protein
VSSNEKFIEFSEKVFHLDTSEDDDTCEENENLSTTDSGDDSSTDSSSSSSSNNSCRTVSDEMRLADILDWFVQSGLISERNRAVSRNVFHEAVKSNYAKWRITEDQVSCCLFVISFHSTRSFCRHWQDYKKVLKF